MEAVADDRGDGPGNDTELISLCRELIREHKELEESSADEQPCAGKETRLHRIASMADAISRHTPNTLHGIKMLAAAAYALSIKLPDGAPQGKLDLATTLSAHLVQTLGQGVFAAAFIVGSVFC